MYHILSLSEDVQLLVVSDKSSIHIVHTYSHKTATLYLTILRQIHH